MVDWKKKEIHSEGNIQMSEDRNPTCICCGSEDDGGWSSRVVMTTALVLPEWMNVKGFDFSLWEDDIGVKVPICRDCVESLELNGERKVFCSAMDMKLHSETTIVYCSKCPDYMMLPVVCSTCLRQTFNKMLKEYA